MSENTENKRGNSQSDSTKDYIIPFAKWELRTILGLGLATLISIPIAPFSGCAFLPYILAGSILMQTIFAIWRLHLREHKEREAFKKNLNQDITEKFINVLRNESRPYVTFCISTGLMWLALLVTAYYFYKYHNIASVTTGVLITGFLIALYWMDTTASYLAIEQRRKNPTLYPSTGLTRLKQVAHQFGWYCWKPDVGYDSIDKYLRHSLIVFFLAFALALFGSLEDFYTKKPDQIGDIIEKLGFEYLYTFLAFAFFESLLIALIAIEFTTTYFVRDHERASDLVESLLIAGVLDVAAYVALKTILGQPSLDLNADTVNAPYAISIHIALLIMIAAFMSFISSFGAVHYAQLRVDRALYDHLSHLRMLNRLTRLARHDLKDSYDKLLQSEENICEEKIKTIKQNNPYKKTITDILALEEDSPNDLDNFHNLYEKKSCKSD